MNDTTTTELRSLAQRIEQFQLEQKWSDTRLLREVPQIGSSKPYRNILRGKLDELSIDAQLTKYRAALKRVEALRTRTKRPEPEYRTFQNVTESLSAVEAALLENSLRRFVAIVGESGTGKSTVRRFITGQHKEITIAFEAHDHWGGSLRCIANAAVAAFNTARKGKVQCHPQIPTITVENLIGGIESQRLILLVDEAHHLGPRGINMLKSLINACPNLVVVAEFIPSLLKQLTRNNFEECRQLFLNRMCEIVELPSPPAAEIRQLLENREVRLPEKCDEWMESLAVEARSFGNWAFINQFCNAVPIAEKRLMNAEDFIQARDIARAKYTTHPRSA